MPKLTHNDFKDVFDTEIRFGCIIIPGKIDISITYNPYSEMFKVRNNGIVILKTLNKTTAINFYNTELEQYPGSKI